MCTVENYEAINELKLMKIAANYNRWIWETISDHLGQNILEIGAGIGTFTDYLSSKRIVYVTDSSHNCLEFLESKYCEHNNIQIEHLDIEYLNNINIWQERSIDSILCLNVLEHISNDCAALHNMNAVLIQNGRLVLMVPAFKGAYGTIDILDGHFRRYSKEELLIKMDRAHFEVTEIFYFNSIGLLAWFITNKILRIKSNSQSGIWLYDTMFVPLIKVLEKIVRPTFGQSIICIGNRV